MREISGDPIKKVRTLATICRKAGFANPANTDVIYAIGRREGLLAY